ncbi:MAG TPA: alpha/beta fold hydrolase [Candidatus Limnocylindrales bacterium]|jgi:dienelactone hydrolase
MPSLPDPTGPHAIGTLTRHWIDRDRRDIFRGPDAGPRELMVQAWYPTDAGAPGPTAPYVDDARTLEQLALLMGLPQAAFAGLAWLPTHALRDAPIAAGGPYPVLLFSHGRCGVREHNTFQVEDLASHGYVVLAIDHPGAASGVRFPDGRLAPFDPRLLPPWPRHGPTDPEAAFLDAVIPFLVEDVRFVLHRLAALDEDRREPLAGRLDLDRVGILGVSLGGMVAASACASEPGFAALLTMDAAVPWDTVAAGLRLPVMWMSRPAATMRREGWSEADVSDVHDSMRATFEGLPGSGYIVLVPGMYHVDFSDGRLLSPLMAERGICGPIAGALARGIVRAWSLAFFDRHLNGLPAALLDEPSGMQPHLSFERRTAARWTPVGV